MPVIRPFKGILYNPARVNPADVVAPPYDVISDEYREKLYGINPFNIVRLDLSRDPDPYESAAVEFRRWKSEEILVKDTRLSIYILTQEFRSLEGRLVRRRGFIALCRLEDFSAGAVLPHEKTMPGPKEDRLKLMQATGASFSEIFGFYADPKHTADEWLGDGNDLLVDAEFEGIRNRMWRLIDEDRISSLRRFMLDKSIFIADGHHRYETSLLYRDIMRRQDPRHTGDEPYNFVMMYCTNLHDEGLIILPTHRLVHDLKSFEASEMLKGMRTYFEIVPCPNEGEMVLQLDRKKKNAFGVVLTSGCYVSWLRNPDEVHSLLDSGIPDLVKDLDVTVLHNLVFGNVLGIPASAQENKLNLEYVKEIGDAIGAVRQGRAQAAFIMNPTSIDQVRRIARAGFTMPQKSTYFYPKLLSGLVIYSLDDKD